MSDAPDNKVVHIADAIDNAERKRTGQRPQASAGGKARTPSTRKSGGEDEPPPGGGGWDHYQDILPPDFPVRALGQNPTTLFFFCAARQLHAVEIGKFGRTKILQMVGNRDFLWERFPSYSKGSDPANGPTGWKHAEVSERMIDACVIAGIFDPRHRVRGPGAWRDHQGRLVYHAGDGLWIGAKSFAPGILGEIVYTAGPALPAPLFETDEGDGYCAARVVFDAIATFNWRRGETDAKLLLGWHGAAMLGAYTKIRPLAWITGDRGTGKTLLQEMTDRLHGAALVQAADATGASLFQTLGFQSVPVAIDEIEADADDARAKQVIKLARLSFSGATVLRGSSGGTAMEFQARSCFLFSSIVRPSMTPAEISRMAFLELSKVTATRALDLSQFDILGRKMRGTLLKRSQRYDETFAGYRAALIACGHKDRSADQFGALGAAYNLLMHETYSEDAAKEWAEMLPARELAELSDNRTEWQYCIDHLMTCASDIFRGGRTESIAYWVREARDEVAKNRFSAGGSDAERVLASHGLRVLVDPRTLEYPDPEKQWYLAVANTHQGLNKLLKESRWKEGGWAQVLKNVELDRGDGREVLRAQSNLGSKKTEVLWLDGRSYRCTFVPWDAVFMEE